MMQRARLRWAPRQGSYPGMPAGHTFNVVMVSAGHGVGGGCDCGAGQDDPVPGRERPRQSSSDRYDNRRLMTRCLFAALLQDLLGEKVAHLGVVLSVSRYAVCSNCFWLSWSDW